MENKTVGLLHTVLDKEFRVLQPIWDAIRAQDCYVASPLFPIVLSVVFYFCCMIPWTYIDIYGKDWKWIQKYKIQPEVEVTWPLVGKAVALTTWNHVLYLLPISIAQWIWTPDTPLPEVAPTLWEFCWHQYASLIVFDFEYYVWHSLHHKIRFLYKHVHAIHHQYHAPSCWVTQYLHPWELISVGIYTTTSPWIFGAHPLTQWSFMLWSIIISVEAHIGFDLPGAWHRWVPFWGGAIKHDMHHQKPLTNFQPFFNWWDRLFGTECPGQLAGGYKPERLVSWEETDKDRKRRNIARHIAQANKKSE